MRRVYFFVLNRKQKDGSIDKCGGIKRSAGSGAIGGNKECSLDDGPREAQRVKTLELLTITC